MSTEKRAPVVVVMGHIDHGKSTLLDYIRTSNVVAGEAGGITQHLSAYEAVITTEDKQKHTITFLDTPGHEAFSKMRARGADTADIAILVVSAEDSVKTQTIEAWNTIVKSNIPYIVAINKIDRPGANIEKTKLDLAEKGIYVEGYGGDVPCVAISAKVGTHIPELLEMIIIVADMHGLTGTRKTLATGVVIEAHLDPKRGISATLIIKNGTLKRGMFLVSGTSIVPARMIEDFRGASISEASFSSPVTLIGWNTMPVVGSGFDSFENKKDAEYAITNFSEHMKAEGPRIIESKSAAPDTLYIPLIIKSDVSGTLDAIEKELEKVTLDNVGFKIISRGVGDIGESDIRQASSDKEVLVVGFNVRLDPKARDLNEKMSVSVETFSIIYKLSEYIAGIAETRRPRKTVTEVTGKLKILKIFSAAKNSQVVGGKVIEGLIQNHARVRIMRRDFEIGTGTIIELQQNKLKVGRIEEGTECGLMVETKTELATADVLECTTEKEI